ncbi:MAG: hypothetical protein OXE17_14765 [Chloroflexi bacterium]|nr:hypothetical protein [Chloroflexota bacterium]
MPEITITAQVPAQTSAVFTHVTAFPAQGEPDARQLESRYGRLESQDGQDFIFCSTNSEGVESRLLYIFSPPHQREMRHLDSDWADRTDTFVQNPNGTEWNITWQPKSKGAPFLIRWLFFRWKDRQRLYDQIMQPVVDHFQTQDFY